MEFSSKTLLNLQRLARIVKKELKLSIHINTEQGIGDLLRSAASESQNMAVASQYNEFIAGLEEKDRLELASYNVELALSRNDDSKIVTPSNTRQKKNSASNYDRRQRNIHIDHDRRKKAVLYRGVLANTDRRQQNLPYEGPDRRGTGVHNQSEDEAMGEAKSQTTSQHTVKGRSYRGVAIDEETAHQKETKPKRKRAGMYRGQKIDYDDE